MPARLSLRRAARRTSSTSIQSRRPDHRNVRRSAPGALTGGKRAARSCRSSSRSSHADADQTGRKIGGCGRHPTNRLGYDDVPRAAEQLGAQSPRQSRMHACSTAVSRAIFAAMKLSRAGSPAGDTACSVRHADQSRVSQRCAAGGIAAQKFGETMAIAIVARLAISSPPRNTAAARK